MEEAVKKRSSTEARVTVLETQVLAIAHNIEKLDEKVDTQYHTLHQRISSLRDDVRSDIDVKHERLMEKLDEHSKQSAEANEKLNDKISALEKWKWSLMGAAAVIGFFLAHVRLDALFGG